MTVEDSLRRCRPPVIQRAAALDNVSQACRGFGISRTLFPVAERYLVYGPEGLHPYRQGPATGLRP